MTKAETRDLIVEILKYYPTYFYKTDPTTVIDAWHAVFSEMPYEFANKALIEHIKEGVKQPTINELYQKAKELRRFDFFDKGGRI